MKLRLRLPKLKTVVILGAVLALGSGSYAAGLSGVDVGRAITESRCRSGAFLKHTTQKTTAESDSDAAAAPVGGLHAMAPAVSTAVTGPNLIPNGDFESVDATGQPSSWQKVVSGDKTKADFTIVSGHNSTTAARVDISSYEQFQPADWYAPAVPVVAGGYYQFHDFYRSNIATRAVLMTEDASGNRTYINLTDAAPSMDWNEYTVTLFVPANAVRANVYHSLAGKGALEIDDVSFKKAGPKGFSRPLVTLTFDDGWRSTHDNALPLLKRYGLVSTQYIISGYIGQSKQYMTPANVYDLRASGNEIASHTVNHLDLTREPDKAVSNELKTSKENLDKCFTGITDFAPPYGTYSEASIGAARKLYETYRSTDTGYNTADGFDPYMLRVQNVDRSTTQSQIQSWLDIAAKNNTWLILVYHQVDETSSFYARNPADFESDLKTIKASNLTVKTMAQAYAEIASSPNSKAW